MSKSVPSQEKRLISVCIAAYNPNSFFVEQLDSILSQNIGDEFNLEIIVSDDSDNDKALRIVEQCKDDRIAYHRHKPRKKFRFYNNLQCATQNFSNAIRLSHGDFVFLCDQDDLWYPDKISTMVEELERTGKHFVSSSFHWMCNGNVFSKTLMHPLSLMNILLKSGIYGFSCAFTREFAEYILPFPNVHQHDTYIGALAVKNDVALFDERILAAHRCYPNQTSNSGFRESIFIKVLFRLKLIFSVFLKEKFRKE